MDKQKLLELGCSESAAQSILQCFAEQESLHETEIKQLRLDAAVDAALTKVGVRNKKAVRALIDFESVSFGDDGSLLGMSEQLNALRESDGYLFNESAEAITFKGYQPVDSMDGVSIDGTSAVRTIDPNNMSYSQLSAFMGENPDFKLN